VSKEVIAYIGLGSNLGERECLIKKAIAMLDEVSGVAVSRVSKIVETSPLGGLDQPKYLNAVAEVKTSLDAYMLLGQLQKIENTLGRARQGAFSPSPSSRTIDLDILLFGQEIINKTLTTEDTESTEVKTERAGLDSRLRGNDIGDLVVPHPRMHLRSFILNALMELNPHLIHPVLNRSIAELAARLNGRDFVIGPDAPQLISIAGIIGVGKTTLARGLAENLGAQLLLEAYDTNPFLAKVYAGQKEYALDSQLHFLTTRVEQIGRGSLGGGQIAVTDYIFEKEKIYAKRLLDPQQQSIYFKINADLSPKVCPPTLAIYLKDTPQNCLDRIHQRNRPYEQRIELDFLQTQYDDYEELVKNWTHCPMITVSMDCRDVEQVKKLTQEVKAYIS
jgi:2-amino-4-hydroxy-6-hydroxymethyldihydropteridine diphosphokinase